MKYEDLKKTLGTAKHPAGCELSGKPIKKSDPCDCYEFHFFLGGLAAGAERSRQVNQTLRDSKQENARLRESLAAANLEIEGLNDTLMSVYERRQGGKDHD